MVTTTSVSELMRIVHLEHHNPHSVLGMHETETLGRRALAVRVFLPYAREVVVMDEKEPHLTYHCVKLHEDGFFEAVIEQRHEYFKYLLRVTYEDGLSLIHI